MIADPKRFAKVEEILVSKHDQKPFGFDISYDPEAGPRPVVVFVHGFKVFKDWGPFNLIAAEFVQAGFTFVKINLSHNGTTIEEPARVVDHDAFRKNNLSIELDDVQVLLDHLFDESSNKHAECMDLSRLYLMGHSRGGALALLKAAEDQRVQALVTWCALSSFEDLWSWIAHWVWKLRGVFYEWDQWHQQHLPVDYQLADDFYTNQARYHLRSAIEKNEIPLLVVHTRDDRIIPVRMARDITHWHDNCEGVMIPKGGHLLDMYHPYPSDKLPLACAQAVKSSISFLKRQQ